MVVSLRAFALATLALLFLLLPRPGTADERAELQELFSALGATVESSEKNGTPSYEIIINKRDFITAVPILQKYQMLNPDLTTTYINLHQVGIATVAAQQMAVAALSKLYEGATNHVKIAAFLMEPDDLGHLQKREIFRFAFTKEPFKKIDWDNFEMTKFSKVAPNFAFSPWVMRTISEEMN